MMISLLSIWEISRKEFYEHLKTKRFILISGLYALGFILSIWISSYYNTLTSRDFLEILAASHSVTSIFYAILPIALSYDLISRERINKSIYLLLSKPVNREEVVLGKFLGVFLVICSILIPVVTIGSAIFSLYHGTPSPHDLSKSYLYLGAIILATSCYISLSLLFSTFSRSSATSLILSLIIGWFGLSMIYPLSVMYRAFSGNVSGIPWYVKIAYAISPYNNLNSLQRIISKPLYQNPPISVEQSIFSLIVFLVVTLLLSLIIFKKEDLS